ncbi:MFS transporter [Patulibacter sp. SYSU D01012]|uniref:MFS transporter n=1 Tax=Patulibacter sp. SYSU D01012 TaxID=2817381 RepID=UPI001B312CB2|nr:MFS transporter [Patulibacter sp. SYSU D01012]
MPLALLALAIGAFGIGTTEFVIAGLLPEVAATFDTSVPTAGLLISGYALGVAIGAPLITAATTRLPRKAVLLGLMGLFIAGNLVSAVAPTYAVMLVGRILAALCHGAFFGIGSVVAASVVAPERRAQAIALMFTGLTLANVLGVPLGTLLGQHLGWRSTFWVVTGLGVVAFLGIAALVPHQPGSTAGLRGELAAFRRPGLWLAFAMTALGYGGVFATFTFVAPMMTEVAGFSDGAITPLLVVFGVGLVLGNLFGGRLADRGLMPALHRIFAGLLVVAVVFAFTAHSQVGSIVTLFAFGFAGFATVPPLQSLVLRHAPGAPMLASAGNIAAFNLGNALGAWLAGLAISAGLGYTSPNWVAATMVAAALGVAAVASRLERRDTTAAAGAPAGAAA